MDEKEILILISDLLNKVIAGKITYSELQKTVDDVIINDHLPQDIPNGSLKSIYALQTDLELIAEHQSSSAGTNSYYSSGQIASLLEKYAELFKISLEGKS